MSQTGASLTADQRPSDEPGAELTFDDADRRLLNDFQRDFPLVPRPYAEIGREIGVGEQTVLGRFSRLKGLRALSRVGAIVAPQRTGWSTLAAMAVPFPRLQAVADLVSSYDTVNHNYEREHRFNLWFVVTGPDQAAVQQTLAEIETATGLTVLDLPLLESYRLDLGFPLQWT